MRPWWSQLSRAHYERHGGDHKALIPLADEDRVLGPSAGHFRPGPSSGDRWVPCTMLLGRLDGLPYFYFYFIFLGTADVTVASQSVYKPKPKRARANRGGKCILTCICALWIMGLGLVLGKGEEEEEEEHLKRSNGEHTIMYTSMHINHLNPTPYPILTSSPLLPPPPYYPLTSAGFIRRRQPPHSLPLRGGEGEGEAG
ncbi:hypothetical protein EON65_55090, partial [archaeon]